MVPVWRFQYFRQLLPKPNLKLMASFPNNNYWAYTFLNPWALKFIRFHIFMKELIALLKFCRHTLCNIRQLDNNFLNNGNVVHAFYYHWTVGQELSDRLKVVCTISNPCTIGETLFEHQTIEKNSVNHILTNTQYPNPAHSEDKNRDIW